MLVAQGISSSAAQRNWDSYGYQVSFAPPAADLHPLEGLLLTDPQTSGGLLLAVSAEGAPAILDQLHAEGYEWAAVIGECIENADGVEVIC